MAAPGELVLTLIGLIITANIALIIVVLRIGEKVTRMEEWIRQQERRNGRS